MWKLQTNRLFSANRKNILVSLHEKVALVKLNRPSALNSLNTELMTELGQALKEIESNKLISCVVLSGDLKSFAGNL